MREMCAPMNDATHMHVIEGVNELGGIISSARCRQGTHS
jgi:hypothetical protein